MSYTALLKMREINAADYGLAETVSIPDLPQVTQNYGREALSFLRDLCEELKFDLSDEKRRAFSDSDGRSSAPTKFPIIWSGILTV